MLATRRYATNLLIIEFVTHVTSFLMCVAKYVACVRIRHPDVVVCVHGYMQVFREHVLVGTGDAAACTA